jgi:hypothetical protein
MKELGPKYQKTTKLIVPKDAVLAIKEEVIAQEGDVAIVETHIKIDPSKVKLLPVERDYQDSESENVDRAVPQVKEERPSLVGFKRDYEE